MSWRLPGPVGGLHISRNIFALKKLLIHGIYSFSSADFSNSFITSSFVIFWTITLMFQNPYTNGPPLARHCCALVTVFWAALLVDLPFPDPNWCQFRSHHTWRTSATTVPFNWLIQLFKWIGLHPLVFSLSLPGLAIITALLFWHYLRIVPLIKFLAMSFTISSRRIVSWTLLMIL